MSTLKIRKILSLIGPYPYNPLLIFAFFTACYFSRFIPVVIEQPHGIERYLAALAVLMLAIMPSAGFAITAALVQKYRRWSGTNLVLYILEVALGQSLLFIFAPIIRKFLQSQYGFRYEAPLTLSVGLYFGSLFVILISLALLHSAELSIIKRLATADKLALQLQRDREELIFSDEELRKQTSQFLHDRVQSDLMVVAMILKNIQGQSSPEVEHVLTKAIARLESTRASDLKNLIQILSPNFELGSLEDALDLLKFQYRPSINVVFYLDFDTEILSGSQRLGIFRMTEQALLNSLVHGPATQVRVSLRSNSCGLCTLEIVDDGPGANANEMKSGVGSAIIDSWVSILSGVKEVDSAPGYGYHLKVSFPE